MADGDQSEGFYMELRESNRMSLKNKNGQYLITEKNGGLKLGESSRATLWEF